MQSITFIYLIFLAWYQFTYVFSQMPGICPKIITKTDWGARTPVQIEYSLIPINYVVLHHTVTEPCTTQEDCINTIKSIQNFHLDELEFHDIGYNFVIGGDGNVYEAAGWHKVGAHTRGYNTRSLGIALIGNFNIETPSKKQIKALQDFLSCAVELGELDKRYKLLGARQVSSTESPGLKLYDVIKKWPNFVKNP